MFRRFSAGQRRSAVGAVALMAVEAATALVVPILIGDLTNFLKDGKPWRPLGLRPSADATIPLLAVSIVVATAVNSLSEALSDVSLAKAGRVLGYNLRTALFSHLQKLSLAFHVRRSTGDVLTRITGDVQALEEFVVESVSDLLGSGLLLAGTLVYLFSQSWRIALLAVVIVPLLASVSSYFARRIKAASKELRAREGDLASTAAEMLTTISVVQAYGRARHEQKKFDSDSRHAMDAVLRTARLEALFSFTVSVMEALVIAVVVVLGARLVESDTVTAGLLVSFILLIQNMFKPTRRIIKEWNTVAKIYASVERISELLDREPAVQDAPGAREAPPLSGAVEFRDVSFAYQPQGPEDPDGEPARLTLQSVSFTLAAGEVVALVGHSGAGKSTIAQLLPRLYDPQSGAVLVDGHDIRTFTVDSLRAQISMVLQETILLRGTVAENIAYGREGASREDVVIAAQRAHAHDFITAMAEGYDTVLGERAATLSGGQRQRLAIARAFIRDTPILVLDEPTTGLDALSSAAVAEALQSLLTGPVGSDRLARPQPDPRGGPHPGALRGQDPRGGHARQTCSSGAGSTPTSTRASSARPPPSSSPVPPSPSPRLPGVTRRSRPFCSTRCRCPPRSSSSGSSPAGWQASPRRWEGRTATPGSRRFSPRRCPALRRRRTPRPWGTTSSGSWPPTGSSTPACSTRCSSTWAAAPGCATG